jgi:cellobiose phosphorylase
VAPHSGRGGWTWYTGAAGWLYRVGLEYMLGFMKKGDRLVINPCIPREWSEYSIEYRYKSSVYQITVKNPDRVNRGVREVMLDSEVMEDGYIPLSDDGKRHTVVVTLGEKPGYHA